MQNKSSSSNVMPLVIIVGLLIITCICCTVGLVLFAGMADSFDLSEETVQNGNRDEQIAIIEVDGVITSAPISSFWGNPEPDMVSVIINKLDKAQKDDNVKAIILDIDSPGGEVYGSELIAKKVRAVKEEGKIVVSLMRSVAASGGYYVAAPSDKIVASQTTITGSIGVFLQVTDMEGLYDKLGIKTYYVVNTEGDLKVVTGGLDDETSEAYQVLQSILDDTYEQFVEEIVNGRGLTKTEVVKLADGRVYSGKRAKEIGLVDEIGYLDKAISVTSEEADLDNPRIIRYNDNVSYLSNINSKLGEVFTPFNQIVDPGQSNAKVLYQMPY